jgi:hypothetical protein
MANLTLKSKNNNMPYLKLENQDGSIVHLLQTPVHTGQVATWLPILTSLAVGSSSAPIFIENGII